MDYTRSVSYIFENKDWWKISLLSLLCLLIPVVGFIAYYGYLSILFNHFLRTKKDELIPFEFSKFSEYLSTGIWSFLGILVYALGFMLVFGIIFGMFFGVGAALNSSLLVGLSVGIGGLLYFIYIILLSMISIPIYIGGALGKSFESATNTGFIKKFVLHMWVEIIVSMLFLGFVSIIAMVAGTLMCLIGTYLLFPLLPLVQWHLYYQKYQLYLTKVRVR